MSCGQARTYARLPDLILGPTALAAAAVVAGRQDCGVSAFNEFAWDPFPTSLQD